MKKVHWISIIAIVVVVSVVLGMYRNKLFWEVANENTVRIGVVIPTTGIAAVVGENEKNGIQFAIDEINKSGGILGKTPEVVFEDDHTDSKQTVSALQKLISVDRTDVLIGGAWDFLANASIPVVEQEKKVMITPSALPDTLEKASDFLFVTHSPVSSNERAVTGFLKKTVGDRVAIISVNNLWGQAHLAMFKKSIEASGKLLVKEVTVPQFDNNDIQRELSLIKPLQPDIFVVALNFGDSSVFLQKKKELGINGKVLGDFHILDGYNQGSISKELLFDTTIFVFSDPTQEFNDKYTKVFGKQPGTYADTAYDAVYVIKQAIENSGGKTDSDSIIRGIHQITHYQGASGQIDFSQRNYPENKVPILKTFNGTEFVNVVD